MRPSTKNWLAALLAFGIGMAVSAPSHARFTPLYRILTTSKTDHLLSDFGVNHPTLGDVTVYSVLNCYPGQDGLVEGPPVPTGSDDDCASIFCGVNFSQRNNTVMPSPGLISPDPFMNGFRFTNRGSYSYNGLDTTIANPPAACLPAGADLVVFMDTAPFGLNASVEPCIREDSENPSLRNCRTGLIGFDEQCFDTTGTEPLFPFGSISFTLTDFVGGVSTLRTVGTSIFGTEGIFPQAGLATIYLDDCTVNDMVCQGNPSIPCTSDPDCIIGPNDFTPCEPLNSGFISGPHGGNVSRTGLRVDLKKVVFRPNFEIPQNLLAGISVPIGSMGFVDNLHPCTDPSCPEKFMDPPEGEPILNFAADQFHPPGVANPARNIEDYVRHTLEPAILLHAAEEGTSPTSYWIQFSGAVLSLDAPIILPLATSSNVLVIWTDDPVPPEPNADGDPVADAYDNCTLVDNPTQLDADDDDFGNACDCDYDLSDYCSFIDFAVFLDCFGKDTGPGVGPANDPACTESDQDGNLVVGFGDFTLFVSGFGSAPGPRGFR